MHTHTHTRVLQKKNSHPVTVIAKKLACPLSPNSMLLHRFAWIGKYSHFRSDAGMHWATTLIKGCGGIRCDLATSRRMAVFFEEPGFFCLWMCNHKLGQTPFCTCQNPNPNTLSSSKLLATNKEATLYLRKVGPLSHRGCEVFK